MGVNGDEDGGLFQEGRLKNIAKGFMCTCEWLWGLSSIWTLVVVPDAISDSFSEAGISRPV